MAALAYAAATNDDNPRYAAGECTPPVFGVVVTWDILWGLVRQLVAPDLHDRIIHASQDLHFHRALRPGEELTTSGRAHSLRRTRSGSRLTARVTSRAAGGEEVVLDQYATLFLRKVLGEDNHGEDPPGHAFAPAPGQEPSGTWTGRIDEDQTFRYRAASGDENPIHTDHEAARAAGLPGIVVHGLCTMAMCASGVVRLHGSDDPRRLARLAVSFSWPVFPASDLALTTYASGGTKFGFLATSSGKTVIRDGLAEFRRGPGTGPAGVGG